MKKQKIVALVLSALTTLSLLAGCGASTTAASSGTAAASVSEPAAETGSAPASSAADSEAASEAASAAEDTAPETSAAPAAEVLRQFRFTTREYGPNMLFTYDKEGRLEHLSVTSRYNDFSEALDFLISYGEDGQATVTIDPEDAAAYEGTPFAPTVKTVETREDGSLELLQAYTDFGVWIEFDEEGLPTYLCAAQDDLGYLLTYRTDEEGHKALDTATFVYDHQIGHTDTPQEDTCTPEGSFLYEAA